jgi:hypothetical protein
MAYSPSIFKGMLRLILGLCLTATLIFTAAQSLHSMSDTPSNESPPTDNDFVLRGAVKEDLDDIAGLVWAGFPDDPEVHYRFPKREEYPEDYLNWTKKEYEGYIEQKDKYLVQVVETTFVFHGGVVVKRPIALAVWDIAVLTQDNNTGKITADTNGSAIANAD